jgi:hypothetical protein
MSFDPDILDRGFFDLGRRTRAGIKLVRSEWRSHRDSRFGMLARIACVRQGFSSRSAALYGLDGPPDPGHYVSDWHEGAFGKRPNRRHSAMFDDKLMFFYSMRGLTPHVVPVLGFTRRGSFVPIDEAETERPLEAFFGERGRPVVLKPSFGTHGDGIVFVDRAGRTLRLRGSGGEGSASPEALARRIRRSEYIVAPLIEQAAYAREIFPDAINTVRVVTMLDVDTGRPFIALGVHRFGTCRTAPLDSFSKGGVVAEVDLESGALGTLVAPPDRGRRVTLDTHPDTGTDVRGRQVPRWRELTAHLLEIADRLRFLPYVGWDVIVTDDGFLINEGNTQPGLKSLQACRPILTEKRVASFLRHYGVI